jgi:biopolymer transport protein ExbB/TolQ
MCFCDFVSVFLFLIFQLFFCFFFVLSFVQHISSRSLGRFRELMAQAIEQKRTALENGRTQRQKQVDNVRDQLNTKKAVEKLQQETIARSESELRRVNEEFEKAKGAMTRSKRDEQRLRKAEEELKDLQGTCDSKT